MAKFRPLDKLLLTRITLRFSLFPHIFLFIFLIRHKLNYVHLSLNDFRHIMAARPPLVSLIKYKNLIGQLTDSEFDTFLSNFRRKIGREEILRLLCVPFVQRLASKDAADQAFPTIAPMSKIVSDILRARKPTSNPSHKVNITDLPPAMVGEIASYLSQKHYISFSRTNRKMYVDCNSPNRLVRLNMSRLNDNVCPSLQTLTNLKRLAFNMRQISQFNHSNGQRFPKCHNLKTLAISLAGSTISDIDTFISDTSPSLCTVEGLCLRGSNRRYQLEMPKLIQILATFQELTHLRLHMVYGQTNFDSNQLSLVCPKIIDFAAFHSYLIHTPALLESLKSTMSTLTLCVFHPRIVLNGDLSKIKRLCLWAMTQQQINSLLSSCKILEEIAFILNVTTPPRPVLASDFVEGTMRRCIEKQPTLKYLYVSTRGHLDAVCNGIYRGLYYDKEMETETV